MQKTRKFRRTHFSAEVIGPAIRTFREISENAGCNLSAYILSIEHDSDEQWRYDDVNEFLAEYRKPAAGAHIYYSGIGYEIAINVTRGTTTVSCTAPVRGDIETVFSIFESNYASSRLPDEVVEESAPIVFVGHGRSGLWRDLKDHLKDLHGYDVRAYETGARAGHSIRNILEEMVDQSSFALLVMTAEDEQIDGDLRARQNVVHEAGLFQGRLGFPRAVMLVEEGVEPFSNVQGIQHIPFARGNIREAFGDVLATLRREFG